MICANKTLSTFPNGQKLEVLDNFPYLETLLLSRGTNYKHVIKAAVVADILSSVLLHYTINVAGDELTS